MEPQEISTERGSATAHAPGFRRCAMRVIHDERCEMVLVYELEPSAADTGPRTLVIESRDWSSRLTSYPTSWRSLRPEELLALRKVDS